MFNLMFGSVLESALEKKPPVLRHARFDRDFALYVKRYMEVSSPDEPLIQELPNGKTTGSIWRLLLNLGWLAGRVSPQEFLDYNYTLQELLNHDPSKPQQRVTRIGEHNPLFTG